MSLIARDGEVDLLMDPSQCTTNSSETADDDFPWMPDGAMSESDNDESDSSGTSMCALQKGTMGREVEVKVAQVENDELEILSRCRMAMALGIGTMQGEQTMRFAICDLLHSRGTVCQICMLLLNSSTTLVMVVLQDC